MKKLLLLAACLTAPALAEYTSPVKFEDWSCKEMSAENVYLITLALDVRNRKDSHIIKGLTHDRPDKFDSPEDAAMYQALVNLELDISTETKALEEAMRRAGCENSPKK